MNEPELIQQLIDMVDDLSDLDRIKLDAILRRAEMIIRNLYKEEEIPLRTHYMYNINFSAPIQPISRQDALKGRLTSRTGIEKELEAWRSGVAKLRNVFEIMLDEYKLFGVRATPRKELPEVSGSKSSVEDIHSLITKYDRRLQHLKQREAKEGISVDPKVTMEIEDIEAKITSLQTELKSRSLD